MHRQGVNAAQSSRAASSHRTRGRSAVLITFAATLLLLPLYSAGDDPAGLASNGFNNNGEASVPASAYEAGKKERDSKEYKKENADAAQRDYYERGGASSNHDSACRARIAYKAARYQGPKNGYEAAQSPSPLPGAPGHKDGPRPKAGGGNYADKMPADAEAIINNIYKFVEDLTYPKGQPSDFEDDADICKLADDGTIDIGKPRAGNQFMCIETALFFTSLVRELGFPVREKNVLPSFADGSYDVQTAAANVWYGGKWHFFDPWESFTDSKSYLSGTGHAGYVLPTSFHDADIWVRTTHLRVTSTPTDFAFTATGTPGFSGWKKLESHKKNGAKIESQTFALRLGVSDGLGRVTGDVAGTPLSEIPNSIYVPHDKLVQADHASATGPGTYGIELVSLLFADDEPAATHNYNLIITNPGTSAQSFEVTLAPSAATTEIQISPPQISGVLAPGESRIVPVQVIIGPPLTLPPAVVDDLRIAAKNRDLMTLVWSGVAAAAEYHIYRSAELFDDPAAPSVEFLGGTTQTSVQLQLQDGEVIGIVAVDGNGLPSAFDPEDGSTFVAQICDINNDDRVDRGDIRSIFAQRNARAFGPADPLDADGDGLITVNDARYCTLKCDKPRCAP